MKTDEMKARIALTLDRKSIYAKVKEISLEIKSSKISK